jgi:DNA-binding transcriptional ArsR family regulator
MNCCQLPPRYIEALSRHLNPGIFKALGDETRVRLLARVACARAPMTVSEAASCCGVHLSGVSRHLKLLKDAGLVEAVRQGREVRYRACCAELAALLRGLAEALEGCCCAGDTQAANTLTVEREHERA